MNLLKYLLISSTSLVLIGCAANIQTTSNKSPSAGNSKIHGLNVIYVDNLHKGNMQTVGTSTKTVSFTDETRKKFAEAVLKTAPLEFQTHNIEAIVKGYKLKKDQSIDTKEINSLFPDSKAYPLLIISPTQVAVTCSDICGYEMEVKSKILDMEQGKVLWESQSGIGKELLGKHAFISTTENAKKFVKTLAEKMKADGLF